jgi:N-acetylneuraminic acid mutarotase
MRDTWTQKSDFPGTPRVVPFSFSVDGVGYIGGGDPTNMNFGSTNDFWKYNPETDSWTRLADFPSGNTIGLSGFSLAGVGYVLETGPGNPTAPVAASYSEKLWRYNISADAWEQKASLPTRKFLSGVTFTINDKAYAGLGAVYDWDNTTQKDDFWQYDPVQDTWIKKQDTGGGLRWLGTGFAIGGKGYVGLGTGNTYDAVKDDFWEYTPD